MYELLFNSFQEKSSVTKEEWEFCKTFFTPKKLRKRQYLLQEGAVCSRLAFVEKGALYSYSRDNKGVQHVIQFAFEGWWIADLYSFFTKEPSRLNIEVLEECELLILDYDQHHSLLQKLPSYETYSRILYQNAYVALQRRMEDTIGLTAEERYLRLLDQYASLLNKVPLHLIASYLGVTPETLSRIRKQMTR